MRNIYIFDLDDTLYQIKSNEYINKVNKQELRKLNGIKILFSNATFGHVSILMKELGITDIFNVVFTTDILVSSPDKSSEIFPNCSIVSLLIASIF